jgi:hypothetical protein
LVSRVLRPRSGPSPLARAIAELKAEARAEGLTDADIDAKPPTKRFRIEDLPKHGLGLSPEGLSLRREDVYDDDGW